MQQRKKIFLALPRHPDLRNAINHALQTSSNNELASYVLTRDICDAEIVIADTPTIDFDLTTLPQTVRYLQIIDCGPGEPHASDHNIIVANASSLLASNAANQAIQLWQEIANQSQDGTKNVVAGIIGFGTLGYQIGRQLSQISQLDTQIWINDIRTPRQQSFQQVGARRSSLDMLLSTSHIIFIAIHPGPTSKPLLTHRELRLLTTNSTIINLSAPEVVDKTAIQTLNTTHHRQINYREMYPDLGDVASPEHSELVTRYILDNLHKYAQDQHPRSIIEPVTHPKAGDPAFWASRMHPRQTPV